MAPSYVLSHLTLSTTTTSLSPRRQGPPSVDWVRRRAAALMLEQRPQRTTALHCAASDVLSSAFEAVQMPLVAGADADATDESGCRPAMIFVPPKITDAKIALEYLLGSP